MSFKLLLPALFCVALPAFADLKSIEWACGSGGFVACFPDPKNPVTVLIDDTKKPPTYSSNGIDVEMDDTGNPPHAMDDFSFAFNTTSFALVIDLTFNQANPGNLNAEDVRTSSVFNVQTEKDKDGLIHLTFDTLYENGTNGKPILPQDYRNYLGSQFARGDVEVVFDPEADANGNSNVVQEATIRIFATPEPGSILLLASCVVIVGSRLRRRITLRSSA